MFPSSRKPVNSLLLYEEMVALPVLVRGLPLTSYQYFVEGRKMKTRGCRDQPSKNYATRTIPVLWMSIWWLNPRLGTPSHLVPTGANETLVPRNSGDCRREPMLLGDRVGLNCPSWGEG